MLQHCIKKYFSDTFAVPVLFSCSSSKKTTGSVSRDEVKGTWQLDNINL